MAMNNNFAYQPNSGLINAQGLSAWNGAVNQRINNPMAPNTVDPSGDNTGAGNLNGWFGNSGVGLNIPTFQLGAQALGSLGNIFNAFQANKMAKKSFDFTKKYAETNLANSIKSYNTSLTDRARSRGVAEGQSQSEIDNYVSTNRL